MDVLRNQILYGYDITVSKSSLGIRFREQGSRFCVNAFHGYAHNYACQLKNHPMFVEGMGLEDLETLERVFSASNAVAPLTRHASAYSRHVFIDIGTMRNIKTLVQCFTIIMFRHSKSSKLNR
jgi:hypothetical protein